MAKQHAHLSDEALVALVARGDETALAELYDRVSGIAYGLALRVLRDERLAEDAVQEAFATAVRKRRSFRGDGPLEAWRWRIVLNAARLDLRRSLPVAEYDEPAAANGHPEPYGVKYWEIGNENYGNGHYGSNWEADNHADKIRADRGANRCYEPEHLPQLEAEVVRITVTELRKRELETLPFERVSPSVEAISPVSMSCLKRRRSSLTFASGAQGFESSSCPASRGAR
jgi:DNA-directed RNA polymerase specialized sigma24 family protein